jgi:hypothetical protein
MQAREKQREWAGMYYDDVSYNADRREVATVQAARQNNGTGRQRQNLTLKPIMNGGQSIWRIHIGSRTQSQ